MIGQIYQSLRRPVKIIVAVAATIGLYAAIDYSLNRREQVTPKKPISLEGIKQVPLKKPSDLEKTLDPTAETVEPVEIVNDETFFDEVDSRGRTIGDRAIPLFGDYPPPFLFGDYPPPFIIKGEWDSGHGITVGRDANGSLDVDK